MRRKLLVKIYFGIGLFALVFLALFALEAWRNPSAGAYWHIAALIGSIIIAAGWIVTSENTVKNNARQHTITVILDYDRNVQHDKNWDVIIRYVPGANDILGAPEEVGLTPDHELYRAVDRELDFLEFIALGVLNEVLDNPMTKSAFQVDFQILYKTAKPYMDWVRQDDSEVWEAFYKLAVLWEPKSNSSAKAIC